MKVLLAILIMAIVFAILVAIGLFIRERPASKSNRSRDNENYFEILGHWHQGVMRYPPRASRTRVNVQFDSDDFSFTPRVNPNAVCLKTGQPVRQCTCEKHRGIQ
jgi:uncharacterized protein (DUF58 family)